MQNLGFARNLHHRTGNDKVTELLLRLSIFCLFLAFEQEKTGLSTGCFRFLFFSELFGRSDLIRHPWVHYPKGSERDQLGIPD